jgi:hypothetical protein
VSLPPVVSDPEVCAYVEKMEAAICGEYHLDDWPQCDEEDHAEGRRLLGRYCGGRKP